MQYPCLKKISLFVTCTASICLTTITFADVNVDATGNLGIGTASPSSSLHVVRDDNSSQVRVEETSASSKQVLFELIHQGNPQFNFVDSAASATWSFRLGEAEGISAFFVTRTGTGGSEFTVLENGDADLRGTLNQGSSRSIKENLQELNGSEILSKVIDLPITEWQYKMPGNDARHVGPVSEDFHAVFGLGKNEKTIAPTDLAGIALVAAKELAKQNETLKEYNQDISEELENLRHLYNKQEQQLSNLEDEIQRVLGEQ